MSKLADGDTDPGIPTLTAALDLAELTRQLKVVLEGQWDTSQKVCLRVLKWHKASRCTFEIALNAASGRQELIGKVYAEDRIDVYHAMQEIQRSGFGAEDAFSVARPLAYVQPLHLLFYEKVPGTRARSRIADPSDPDRLAAVERCARWLAQFQARGPLSGRLLRIEDDLMGWEKWWRAKVSLGLPIARKGWRLLEELSIRAPELTGGELCAGHGMYTCGQVILNGGQTVTVDWDTFNRADPSHDVARFLIDLKRMSLKYFGSLHALAWAAKAFLEAYQDEIGSRRATQVAFCEAVICLERAKSDVDKQVHAWREKAEIMLDEGLRILALGRA